jgi:hypothetical protein
MGQPGLAIHYLEQALRDTGGESAEADELHRELGFLYAAGHQYDKAAEAWSRLQGVSRSADIALRLAGMRRLLGEFDAAHHILTDLDTGTLPVTLKAVRFDELALVAAARGREQDAVVFGKQALETEASASRHYTLGLAYGRSGETERAAFHLHTAATLEPANDEYALAVGYAEYQAGRTKNAIRWLDMVASRNPAYRNAAKDIAYFYRAESDNRSAAGWFRKAIDGAAVDSAPGGSSRRTAERELFRLRGEVRTLNERYSVTGYMGYRSNSGTGAASIGGGGVLRSQGGVEFAYRPERIGFRAGRIFQLAGRILWNMKPDSFRLDSDSMQAGIGVRYHPLESQNLFVSAERIAGLGRAVDGGWLWRGLYSWSRGRDVVPGAGFSNYSLIFGDAGYLTSRGGTTAAYAELHQGAAFSMRRSVLIKPHLVADGRFQNRDSGVGKYLEAGGGVALQFFFAEQRYETHRVGFELLIHFKRSWLQRGIDSTGKRVHDGWSATSLVHF